MSLYYCVCILVRITISILAYLIAASDNLVLKIAAALLSFIVGLGFMINWWTHKPIGYFKGHAWWHDLRLFHSLVWWNVAFLFIAAGWITDRDLVASSIAPVINILINLDWIAGVSFKWLTRYERGA